MPVAVRIATSGMIASSEPTRSDHLPVGSIRMLPCSRPKTSTFRSKMPMMPSRVTDGWSLAGVVVTWVGAPGPPVLAVWLKSRVARSRLIAIDSTTMPSWKPKSARPMLGP